MAVVEVRLTLGAKSAVGASEMQNGHLRESPIGAFQQDLSFGVLETKNGFKTNLPSDVTEPRVIMYPLMS